MFKEMIHPVETMSNNLKGNRTPQPITTVIDVVEWIRECCMIYLYGGGIKVKFSDTTNAQI